MSELARRVGLGLAARGDVDDVVAWAEQGRDRGLESVWLHDSYFERDAVTYSSAIASQVDGIRVGLGALNAFTRHPVVVAMTVSALDDMAPGRIALALGTGLPLRLAQMGIPYSPGDGVARTSRAIDDLRALWRGDRLSPGKQGVPELQPMFPPVHRVPIFIAAYRTPMLRLCGEKADGYLARPAESLSGFKTMLRKVSEGASSVGRTPDHIEASGYLLTLTDETRRAALNRAKREPFVIYMMSILSDITLERAGFETELRDGIAAAWRAEDYHRAAESIPDELLEAFILCGTVEDVAGRAWDYHEAGMDVPLLQPVVQDEEQVQACLDAAVVYASEAATATSARVEQQQSTRTRKRPLAAYWEIARPFAFTASIVPVAAGGALAATDDAFSAWLFVGALLASVLLQLGTNVINEIYDVRQGVDSIVSPRASHAIVEGKITEGQAFLFAFAAFGIAAGVGVWLIAMRGWPVAVLGALGLLGGFGYTAPPFQYKYKALGVPLVFLLMGPLMVIGAYYVTSGSFDAAAIAASIPLGLLVAAILHGNEWRDISEDARAGIQTLSIRLGRRVAHIGYVSLIVGAYLALTAAVIAGALPEWSLLAMLSLPLLVRVLRSSELGASGQQRAIAMIDLQTAQLHAVFGALLVIGLAVASFVR